MRRSNTPTSMLKKLSHDGVETLSVPMLAPTITREIERALHGLRYGSIQLVIHDAHVVRIERIERIRLTDSSEASDNGVGRPTTSMEVCHDAQER